MELGQVRVCIFTHWKLLFSSSEILTATTCGFCLFPSFRSEYMVPKVIIKCFLDVHDFRHLAQNHGMTVLIEELLWPCS